MRCRKGWSLDEKLRFVLAHERGELTMAELCRQERVSRESGYEWVRRYSAAGLEGLRELSRAAHHHPNEISAKIEAAVIAARHEHSTRGPRKLRAWLQDRQPRRRWPAASTIGEILNREGLTVPRKRRQRVAPRTQPFAECHGPNDSWAVDFKGWFLTGDGRRCDPLTRSDSYSRYLLRCQLVERCNTASVWPIFDAAFREFGLPKAMRSDNGPPFAGKGAGGLTGLSVKLVKAGVLPERITPGKPQQNGRHERMHLTLKRDTANPPARSWREQQRRFAAFRRLYNEERPHEALGQTPPARHYQASPQRYSGRLHEPEYADDRQVRRVRSRGEIKWRGELLFVSEALIGEPVGILAEDDGSWVVSFGPIELGLIDAEASKLRGRRRSKDAAAADSSVPPNA